MVAPPGSLGGRRWLIGVAGQPARHIVVIILLAPEHARQRLPLHPFFIVGSQRRLNGGVKQVGLGLPLRYIHIAQVLNGAAA